MSITSHCAHKTLKVIKYFLIESDILENNFEEKNSFVSVKYLPNFMIIYYLYLNAKKIQKALFHKENTLLEIDILNNGNNTK